MAPEDRDRSFEKALARHLRSAAPGRFCLDAEILAAYHERSLFPQEMDFWKEHISGCGHCQAVLAQLEATEEIALQAAEINEAVLTKESEPVAAAQSRKTLAAAAAPSPGQTQAAAAVAKSRVSRPYAGARWEWLAPAGAIAAGLLVWIALHEGQPFTNSNPAEIKVASNPPAAPSAPLPSLRERGSSTQALPGQSASRPEERELALAKPQLEPKVQKKQGQIAEFADKVPAHKLSDVTSGERKDLDQSVSQLSQSIEVQKDVDSKMVTGAAPDKLQALSRAQGQTPSAPEGGASAQAQDQAVNIQAQNQVNANAAPVPGPAVMGQVEATGKMKAAAPAKPAQPAAPARNELYAARSIMGAASVLSPRLISAPASSAVWRVGRAGLIEFSSDGGNSWARQTSGVSVDLLAGSAPSESVCWIVGRAGSILLTTDGGAHWNKIISPLSEDLGGAIASDVLHAKIWNAGKTKYFETPDRGATWKHASNP